MQVSKASARTRFKLGIIISTPQIETSIYTYSSYLRERAREKERESSIQLKFYFKLEEKIIQTILSIIYIESLYVYIIKNNKKTL